MSLVVCLSIYGCSSETQQSSTQRVTQISTLSPPAQSSGVKQDNVSQAADGKMIWSGESGGFHIQWTTVDLFVQAATRVKKNFGPLVENGFNNFIAVQVEDDQSSEEAKFSNCLYERYFKLRSVVGTLVSFEDQYVDDCGGAHPSADTRFTTIDLARSGEVLYARGEDTPMMDVDLAKPGKIIKLTDYFSEQDILRALLSDLVVKRALTDIKASTSPQTLAELLELFAEYDYELGSTGFDLRPDFLTRFVFHHVEGEKVAVRLGLPPHYGFNRTSHQQLGLLLPIPPALQQSLDLAARRKEGFLMKDSAEIAHSQMTKFSLKTGTGIKRRD